MIIIIITTHTIHLSSSSCEQTELLFASHLLQCNKGSSTDVLRKTEEAGGETWESFWLLLFLFCFSFKLYDTRRGKTGKGNYLQAQESTVMLG